ncbi:hypothetical protein HOLleu_01451 [Holothuria leucospilota]|uniref:Uncharacterized protein n=1 Tax=Holothuria leucospilota TaxID=206669 RepID=A0A9Q1CPZ4_HOLLE|nr:hypothetical protein HOLleu_01451 [Holothuria leucospilota]
MSGFVFRVFLSAPLAGVFDKRVHPRIVALIGGFLAGLGFMGRAFIPSSEPWLLVLCISLSGVGFGLVNVITVISLKETFEPTYYTIAFCVCQLPSYIGIAVMPPLLEYLQREYGEHIGMCVFGVLSWSLMLSGLFTPSGKTDSKDETELADLELLEMQKRSQDDNYEEPLNNTTGIEGCNEQSNVFQHAASTTKQDTEGRINRMKIRKMEKRGKSDKIPVAWRWMKAWIFIAKNHPEFLFLTFLTMLLDFV